MCMSSIILSLQCVVLGGWMAPCAAIAAQVAPPPAATTPASPQGSGDERPKPEYGILTPIPESGGLPKLYGRRYDLTAEEIHHRGKVRGYEKQIRIICHKHLGEIKVPKIRKAGLDQLAEFTDPAS